MLFFVFIPFFRHSFSVLLAHSPAFSILTFRVCVNFFAQKAKLCFESTHRKNRTEKTRKKNLTINVENGSRTEWKACVDPLAKDTRDPAHPCHIFNEPRVSNSVERLCAQLICCSNITGTWAECLVFSINELWCPPEWKIIKSMSFYSSLIASFLVVFILVKEAELF